MRFPSGACADDRAKSGYIIMAAKPPAGAFSILYFASAATYTRKATEHLAAPLPISKLFDILEASYPGFKTKVLSSCAVTINLDYVDIEEDGDAGDHAVSRSSRTIREGDEVAIIPPVSSG